MILGWEPKNIPSGSLIYRPDSIQDEQKNYFIKTHVAIYHWKAYKKLSNIHKTTMGQKFHPSEIESFKHLEFQGVQKDI
jgi:hypothetical protein